MLSSFSRHLLPNAMKTRRFCGHSVVFSDALTADFLGFAAAGSPSLGELRKGEGNVQRHGGTGFFSIALMLSLLIFIGGGTRRFLQKDFPMSAPETLLSVRVIDRLRRGARNAGSRPRPYQQ